MNITMIDLGWIAGFLEGEGHFRFISRTPRAYAAQVQREPLERLLRLVGGRIDRVKPQKPHHQPAAMWTVSGQRCAELLMTLYPLLSPKRKLQAKGALEKWRAQKPGLAWRKYMTHCKRGHAFTPENVYRVPGGRACRMCIAEKSARAYQQLREMRHTDLDLAWS